MPFTLTINKTIKLDLQEPTSIKHIKKLLTAHKINLICGRVINDEEIISENTELIMIYLCFFSGCRNRHSKVEAMCRVCTQSFCGRHRLPEVHRCDISAWKDEARERNERMVGGNKIDRSKI